MNGFYLDGDRCIHTSSRNSISIIIESQRTLKNLKITNKNSQSSQNIFSKIRNTSTKVLFLNQIPQVRNLCTIKSIENDEKNDSIKEFRLREEEKEKKYTNEIKSDPPDEEDHKLNELRIKILNESLQFVPLYGWTRKTLAEGAVKAGCPGITHGIFSEGGIELIHFFYKKCNEDLVQMLERETDNGKNNIQDPVAFATYAIKCRLQMIEPYISYWPQALAMMALPQNVPKSLAQLLTLIDDICYISGDRSVDFMWYTRRVGLATIYKMTEIYMLRDSSIDHQQTWTFLNKRIEEAAQIQSIVKQSEELTFNVQKGISSAFITARNILGLDYNRY